MEKDRILEFRQVRDMLDSNVYPPHKIVLLTEFRDRLVARERIRIDNPTVQRGIIYDIRVFRRRYGVK